MSGVKNLRAMFENKGDDPSPPDRGRSPAGFASVSAGSTSESPRPLSTVRTNFVAIHEKDGRMGLRRHPSHESASPSRRPISTDMDTESISTAAGDEKASRRLFVEEPIPESPQPVDKGAVNDEPSHNPDKQIDEEQSSPTMTSAEPTQQTTATDSALASRPSVVADLKTNSRPVKTAPKQTVPSTRGGQNSTTTKLKTSAKTATTATKPIATAAKRTETKLVSKTQQTTKKEATGTKSSTATRKPAPVKVEQGAGFVKPKPKSPTKPVALPSSLMAPTASSVSKGGSGTGTLKPPAAARASSRAGGKAVRRQPSTVNLPNSSSRPSVGPPRKQTGQESQANKKESYVDEGFLARMMRPTQASASKTAEKAPATPPRKSAPRPSTSTADASSRRGSSVKRQAKVRSPNAAPAISSNVSEIESSAVAEDQLEVNDDPMGLPATEDRGVDLPSSKEQIIPTGKSELEASLDQLEPPDADQDQETTAAEESSKLSAAESVPLEEDAPETAQAETAEEARDLAQTPVEPAEGVPTQEPVVEPVGPTVEATIDEAVKVEEPQAEAPEPFPAAAITAEQETSVEEDGRTSQAVTDEKEEAAMDKMTPPEDVIPEETAVVETAEEVAALAEAGDLVQTPAVPDVSGTGEGKAKVGSVDVPELKDE